VTDTVAYHIAITGVVQGVGFRPFVYNLATRLGLRGWVLNHSGGVEIEVEGPETSLDAFVTALREEAPPLAHIESLDAKRVPVDGYEGFEIRRSQAQEGRFLLISPDVATCPDCLEELFDPGDRRHRYPFINCTNCGPRFTIIEDIPYDRPKTTMRDFPLCDDCHEEYEDPADRRFHAQPNACPECGPAIWLVEDVEDEGTLSVAAYRAPTDYPTVEETEAVLARARELLLSGKVLAIKGLGGFHLACDATNEEAVRVLRERKRRPHKPFAVMMPTLDEVRERCEVPEEATALLSSPQCPIVLLEEGSGSAVAANVAPGNRTLGVMVPYTPLHHILLRDVGRPLVMTSGNVTEEPIAKDNDEALRRLAPLADAFLLHNREIYARYDDSVWQVVELPGEGAHVQPARRARGYAPFPVRLPFEAPRALATGPELKNTFCLARDEYAFLSQHVGDMENLETLEHYEAALALYEHLFRLEPQLVACDLHPDYMTTRLAEEIAAEGGLPEPLRVQHHAAHIAACLADNGWAPDAGEVIGVALDGTGYGEDGAIWGGEWLVGDYAGFRRVAHLEYLPLPGGDAAVKEPWRIAVAYVYALLGEHELPAHLLVPPHPEAGVEAALEPKRIKELLIQQIDRGINTPRTSSMGRLFDAVSALFGVCRETTYEAQAAIELEQVAAPLREGVEPYPFAVEGEGAVDVVRLRPLFEGLLAELEAGAPVAEVSLRFHATVAEMVVEVARRIRERTGLEVVALSGGVFQNALLIRLVVPRLKEAGFEVLLHHQVPPNDGGVALGQAALAVFE
jgi:hydrogenase maturation protein HypF